MTVARLADALDLEILNLPNPDRKIVGGYCGDLLSWVMGRAESANVWVTIMNNVNVVAVAALTDTSCVVFSENSEVSGEVIEKAKEQGVNLLRSQLASFELCGAISALINE